MSAKTNLRIFSAYVRDRLWAALMLLLCTAVFASLCALASLPLAVVGYGCALCLCVGLMAACVDFSRYWRRHAALERLLNAGTQGLAALPTASGLLERDYQALLGTLAAQNERAAGDAEALQRAQSEYYALWAHQIKVPIAAMRLLLQAEPRSCSTALGGELLKVEQYVEMALGFERLNGQSTDYVIRQCALDPVIRQVLRKLAPLFIQKRLKLAYQETALTVLTDEKWLAFALEQVLSNAIKYTRVGTVTIWAEAAEKRLIVEDTGIGIAPEDLPRVFEQGFTGYNGRGDKRATGLGLYLCKRVLGGLSHTIAIASQPGHGTRVIIGLQSVALPTE
ncbi:MAG: sensor histidine kinase [Clostridia bacterium]